MFGPEDFTIQGTAEVFSLILYDCSKERVIGKIVRLEEFE